MVKPSKQSSWQGPKHRQDRQTVVPEEKANRNHRPECADNRHAFGVPESRIWRKGVPMDYYTCALCPATYVVEVGNRP